MAQVPAPMLLSFLVCEQGITDRITGRITLVNLLQQLIATKYPCNIHRLYCFAEFTGGRGQVELEIRLVDVNDEDNALFSSKTMLQFDDVLAVAHGGLAIQGASIPHQGEYRLQIYANGIRLGERKIICLLAKPAQENTVNGE